ncbi:unnamed protein product [Owenia fusiformis]|uniref:Uncharacterized protein n=1 Tax=Owenia fusiformis TaxID=6347 RepID=A0A8J1Y0P4_OWEFU|nr:unnamed protein product [Owenia fusiformis]
MYIEIVALLLAAVAPASGVEPLPDRATLTKLLDEIDGAATTMAVCVNPPAGLPKLRHGYDVGYLDQVPLGVGSNDGTKRVALDYTCNEGKKWRNPQNNVLYDLPDQVSRIALVPGGILQFTSHLWKSNDDIKLDWGDKAGIELGNDSDSTPDGTGEFSFSDSYKNLYQAISSQRRFVEDVSSFVSAFRVDFKSPGQIQLNSGAQTFISRFLPNTYEANPDAWDAFIDYYGTHYYESGNFGGLLKMTMETQKEVVAQLGESATSRNAELTFKNWIGILGGHSESASRVDARFTRSTSSTQRYFGGQGNLLDPQFYRKWVPTIATNPWLFAGRLRPMSYLFPRAKISGMNKAIKVSLNKARLEDMKTGLNGHIANLRNLQTTGSWAACTGASPDRQCHRRLPIIDLGCTIQGCRWSTWPARRNAYIAEARAVLPRITAEERNKGRNDAGVNALGRQTKNILNKMDTKAPLLTRALTGSAQVCRCGYRRCRCGAPAGPMATIKASQPFFNNWR